MRQILARGSLIPNLVVVSSKLSIPTMWVEAFDAAGLAGIHIRDRLLFPFQRVMKRLSDIMLSAVLLTLLSPFFLTIAAWIKIDSGGKVIFHQMRVGRGGRQFKALKFRTMVPDAEEILREYLQKNPAARAEWETFQKLKSDPRVIPRIGAVLRRFSLDELPQLWNVLKGDMSLVGSRPCTPDQIDLYKELFTLYVRMRPGITGLWQISGRNHLPYADRVKLDYYYVQNWSLWLDYYILLRTVRTVFLREGSY